MSEPSFENLDEDDWDQGLADEIVGQTLLVGLTYCDHDGTVIRLEQIFGTVESCDAGNGIAIRNAAGDVVVIAPVLDAIEHGNPGIYKLAGSDEVVEDPDYTALISVRKPLLS